MLVPQSFLYRVFSLRALRSVGRISYGVYIFHDIPHGLYTTLALHLLPGFTSRHSGLGAAIFAVPCTLTLAALSFRFFESPFLNLKERLAPSHAASSSLPHTPLQDESTTLT